MASDSGIVTVDPQLMEVTLPRSACVLVIFLGLAMAYIGPADADPRKQFAEEETGVIIAIDLNHSVIRLNNGRVFQIPREMLEGFSVGDNVVIEFYVDTDITILDLRINQYVG
jgi:hypothetical protein